MSKPLLKWVDDSGELLQLEVVDRICIGRGCRGVDSSKQILVANPQISREHAIVTLSGVALFITDMSKNGTWVNDVRLTTGAPMKLHDNDVIRLGHLEIRVKFPEGADTELEEDWDTSCTRIEPVHMTITNLVADVRGFTKMTQREGSHTVYLLMKEVFRVLTSVVHECKGTMMDHAGDAVYAFWDHSGGSGKTQALRACEAALKQQRRIRELRSSETSKSLPVLERLKMGWGITTGSVTMAHYGARVVDLALVGNSVNMAFRLSGRANKDLSCGIVMCSKTADLIRGHFPLVDLGTVAIRGRRGKDHIFGIEKRD